MTAKRLKKYMKFERLKGLGYSEFMKIIRGVSCESTNSDIRGIEPQKK